MRERQSLRMRREAAVSGWVEGLEGRQLLTVAAVGTLSDVNVGQGGTQVVVDLNNVFNDPAAGANLVYFNTSLGVIPVRLTPGATPLTVANFLNYVESGRYSDTFFHRTHIEPGLEIIQGGGFGVANGQVTQVQTDAPVQNEYSDARTNSRGTISMAKTSDPDSATSQFFFNTADNTSVLNDPNNSGGFTVFGSVVGTSGLAVMDAIAAVPVVNAGGAFAEVPVQGFKQGDTSISLNQLVYVNSVTEGVSYVVSSDNPQVVSVGVRGHELVYTPDFAGTAHITVTAAGLDGVAVTRTFTVQVGQTVAVGKGGKKSVQFKDKDGTVTTVSVTGPGTVKVGFEGNSVTTKQGGSAVTVSGSGVGIDDIEVVGGSAATVVHVQTSGGNGQVDVKHLMATATFGSLDGRGVNLVGASTIGTAIKSLVVRSTSADGLISAGSVGAITMSGNSAGGMNVTGAITSASVGGTLSGTWQAAGIKALSAGSLNKATVVATGAGNSIGRVSAKTMKDSTIAGQGNIASVEVTGAMKASHVYAGVDTRSQPTAEGAAGGTGQIGSLKVGVGVKKGSVFADSSIGAGVIKNATFGNIIDATTVTDTSQFVGVEAGSIVSMTGFLGGKVFTVKKANVQADVDGQLKKEKVAVPTKVKIVVA